MAISAKELAQKLNLSAATVSMALNNKPGISEQTRLMVLDAAQKYGCRISKKADPAEEGSILYVIYRKHGAIVADTPFFSQLTEGIQQVCREEGYELLIYYFYENRDIGAQIQELSEKNCRGILLLGTEMSRESFEPFSRLTAPMVVLDTYFEELNCDSVLINNIQGAYLATNYLISRGMKEIGYLRSSYPIGNFAERADGYYKALRYHGFPTGHPYVHRLTPSMEGAYADMAEILAQDPPVAQAYFADNDLIAAGAIKAFKERGFRIPEDISVIGFDNLPVCEFLDPSLTTMEVPKKRLGELAVMRLLEKISGGAEPITKTEISVRLCPRGSVR